MVEGFEIENEEQAQYAIRLREKARNHIRTGHQIMGNKIDHNPYYECEGDWMTELDFAIKQWYARQEAKQRKLANGGRNVSS